MLAARRSLRILQRSGPEDDSAHGMSRWTAWLVAREHDWGTLRDAECLGVTRLQPYALVTVDPELAAVAGTRRRLPPSTTCSP